MAGGTLFSHIWDRKVVKSLAGGVDLLHVDRHWIHDLEAGPRLNHLALTGRPVRRPDLTFATPDHAVATSAGRTSQTNPKGATLLADMRSGTAKAGIRMFDLGTSGQGIVHVVGPEMGLTLPGQLIVCGDSHTCTHGGLGALAFGIGSSEVEHVLATQTLRQQRPKTLRLNCTGRLRSGISAKDLILYAIGRFGTAAGRGHAVEYAGPAVTGLDIEARLTLCNLSIEMGAKIGMIAPDEAVYTYLANRRFAPSGALFEAAVADWKTLPSAPDAQFDTELELDASRIAPQITWGTSPEDVIPIDARIPDPEGESDPERRRSMRASLEYMGLAPGEPIAGTPIQWVFIGSCTNSRFSDLEEAARLIRGRHVFPKVRAWVVPGSEDVKRQAEAAGLDRIFTAAGFEWREPGCSLCLAANGEVIAPGERSVSTTNRNFVGRQGPGARTHLGSPAMAIAAALAGAIADPRHLVV
jgi:3-isopropylmalate/(R)-2-methylmalate dehydratase large subunit